jgi:hypothetical protein
MPSPITPPRTSAAFVGALMGTAAGIVVVTVAATLSIKVDGLLAAVAVVVPARVGTVVGAAVTPGNTRSDSR